MFSVFGRNNQGETVHVDSPATQRRNSQDPTSSSAAALPPAMEQSKAIPNANPHPISNENHRPIWNEITDYCYGPWEKVALIVLPALLGGAIGVLCTVVSGAPITAMIAMVALGAIAGLILGLLVLETRYRDASFNANLNPNEGSIPDIKESFHRVLDPYTKQLNELRKELKELRSELGGIKLKNKQIETDQVTIVNNFNSSASNTSFSNSNLSNPYLYNPEVSSFLSESPTRSSSIDSIGSPRLSPSPIGSPRLSPSPIGSPRLSPSPTGSTSPISSTFSSTPSSGVVNSFTSQQFSLPSAKRKTHITGGSKDGSV